MLTGMQYFQIDVGVLSHNPGELCDFDEVGAGAYDEQEVNNWSYLDANYSDFFNNSFSVIY